MQNFSLEPQEIKIYSIRNKQVMLDSDLAKLYGIETRIFNQAVKRNIIRFPEEFMFQLTKNELDNLISQFVTSSHGGNRKLPFVFTEQGVSMLSAVLKSETAIAISINIIQSFVNMRKFIATNSDVYKRMDVLENNQRLSDKKFDKIFAELEKNDVKVGKDSSTPIHVKITNSEEFAKKNNEDIKKLVEELIFIKSDSLVVAKELLVMARNKNNKTDVDRIITIMEILGAISRGLK